MKYSLIVLRFIFIFFLCVLASAPAWSNNIVYSKEGFLYQYEIDKGSSLKTNMESDLILDSNKKSSALLSLKYSKSADKNHLLSGELSLVNEKDLHTKKIAANVTRAKFSPNGENIVIWGNNDLIYVINTEGSLLYTVGFGTSPIYSHTGNFIAYQKLSHTSDSHDTLESALGIAIYEVSTNTEIMVTHDPEDFSPVGFSQDENKLFFNSTRAYDNDLSNHIASVWMINIKQGTTKRLTNLNAAISKKKGYVPIIDENAIWNSNRNLAISSVGIDSGVWQYSFSESEESISSIQISDGYSPKWIVENEEIASRVLSNGKTQWKKHSLFKKE